MSSDLKWHEHISNICLKATRTLNFGRCNTYCCSQEAKHLSYLSLVCPYLKYAAAAWDPYMAKDIQQLECVQPLTSTWPHLRCDVGLEEGEYRENYLCFALLCTITMVHKDTSSSYRSVDCFGL